MSSPEFVEYDIIIRAQEAVQALSTLTNMTDSFDEKIIRVSETIDLAAKKWKKSWRDVFVEFQNIDRQMRTMGQQGVFGGQMGGWGYTKSFLEAAEAGGRLKSSVQEAKPAVDQVNRSLEQGGKSASVFGHGINLARIAVGTLIGMAVFRFFSFVENAFKKAIDSAKQFELALYQVSNAEKFLSQAGIDITPKDFDNFITKLKEIFPYLSKIDLSRLVSQVALLTKDLGLTKDQIQELITAIPIMAQRGQITIEQATQQVVNGLANSGRGWKDLGIVVDAAVIRQEAVSAGLVESADAYNKLTAEQKQHIEVLALISILNKSVSGELGNQAEYQKTLAESLTGISSAWEDFLAIVGRDFGPLLKKGLDVLIYDLNLIVQILEHFRPAINMFVAFWLAAFDTIEYRMKHLGDTTYTFEKKFAEFQNKWMDELNRQLPDTPTATPQKSITIDTTDAQKSLKDLSDAMRDLKEKEDKLNRDFDIKQTREAQDHARDVGREEQDYQIKRSRAVQDGNRAIAQKNADFRRKQIEDEAKFQEEMRQLRARYLFDLEDALRERDARQVLRLQEKYRLDKEAAINEHNLKQQQDATEHAADVAQARLELNDKLKQMDEEHRLEMARKEEDYQIKRQRELEDHQRELADIQTLREQKLREAAQEIADELGIKGEGVETIYQMLSDFYGPGGAFEKLYDFANQSMLASAEQMLAQVMALYGQAQAAVQSMSMPHTSAVGASTGQGGGRSNTTVRSSTTGGSSTRHAAGGAFLATGPTQATFGEAGPELATFIPLGRSNALPGPSGGQNGGSGKLAIELLLSPDLEGRIVANTMDATADVIMRTVNSKR